MSRPRGVRWTRRAAAVLAAALVSPACTIDLPASAPLCDADEVLTLMAQAVPEAAELPCLSEMPEAWSVVDFEGQSGRVRFTLSHPVAGDGAVEVRFAATCEEAADHVEAGDELPPLEVPGSGDDGPAPLDPGGAIEQLDRTGDRLQGHVIERVDGGCIVRTYDFDTVEDSELREELEEDLTTIARSDLAARLRERSGGRLDLDAIRPVDG